MDKDNFDKVIDLRLISEMRRSAKKVSQVVMAGLEIKVVKPLFAFKVRFWVGVPPPPPLPPVECFSAVCQQTQKKSYQMSAGCAT